MYSDAFTPEQPDKADYVHKSADCCFEEGNRYFFGEGVAEDREAAFDWYECAAIQGHIGAQYNLGLMYRFGQGVDVNTDLSIYWYRKSADQGYDLAQLALADMYYKSDSKDFEQAYHWYERLAGEGNISAFYNLGSMYANGDWVYQSSSIAEDYLRRAADAGHIGADYKLEKLLAHA